MRALFLNKIAAPVANKMFECGMIPWSGLYGLITFRRSIGFLRALVG
jgi:hypothetical protein